MCRRRKKDEVPHEAEQVGERRERTYVFIEIANTLKDGMANRNFVAKSSTI
jgi:hypothetical protein